jgi:two-component sensor histidine kinase
MALSLMLHELATNAAKYGALSVPEGRVTLSWAVKGAMLSLEWRESGGPAVKEPASKGLGSRLLDRMLGGSTAVSMRFPRSGFEFALEVPVKELSSP